MNEQAGDPRQPNTLIDETLMHDTSMPGRLLDEIAAAADVEPQRHLDAHLWFDLLTSDPGERPQ